MQFGDSFWVYSQYQCNPIKHKHQVHNCIATFCKTKTKKDKIQTKTYSDIWLVICQLCAEIPNTKNNKTMQKVRTGISHFNVLSGCYRDIYRAILIPNSFQLYHGPIRKELLHSKSHLTQLSSKRLKEHTNHSLRWHVINVANYSDIILLQFFPLVRSKFRP